MATFEEFRQSIHAERLLCNFIGAIVRANYFTDKQEK